jgi:hypothetical protein
MTFEDHPVLFILAGVAAVTAFSLLSSAVVNPFAYAATLIGGMTGAGALGLGLAALCERPHRVQRFHAARPSPPAAAEPPALAPEPAGPKLQEALFAQRIYIECADAMDPRRLH